MAALNVKRRGALGRQGTVLVIGVAVLLLLSVVALFSLPSSTDRKSGGKSPSFAATKYLVLTSSSCEDIQPKSWLTPPEDGSYDVVVFDYSAGHTCKSKLPPHPSRTLLHKPKTFKFPAMYSFFTSPEGLRALVDYKAFMLADDDVDFHGDAHGVTRLFTICGTADMHICQPSLSEQSAANFDITVHTPHEAGGEASEAVSGTAYIRLTGLVEQMVPVFSREALMQFLPYFSGVTHAWGIDALWSDVSARLGRKVGVVDSVVIDHMRKSGVSGLYKRVGGIEKARADQQEFKARYGIREEFLELMNAGHAGEGGVLRAKNAL